MPHHIDATDPTGVAVKQSTPVGQVNSAAAQAQRGQMQNWRGWYGRVSATSTATANVSFQNPHDSPIMARVTYVVQDTAGTGTTDIGLGTGGTGDAAEFIDGGTLTVGIHERFTFAGTAAASATAGNLSAGVLEVGANGQATDSIVMKVTDTTTSTAGEIGLFVEYVVLDDGA